MRQRAHGQGELHRPQLGIHPAGDLQPRGAQQARVHDRSAAGPARASARRPAGQCHAGTEGGGQSRREGRAEVTSDIAIDVHGLTKIFDGRAVVRDLSMQVKRGSIYGFLGPNGSGKTTTIRMLCGLLTPDAGQGTCLGYDIRTETDKIKVHVGYMTQRSGLTTYVVSGEGLAKIAAELEHHPDVMIAPFGNSLHVSGRDKAKLGAAIAPYRNDPGLSWGSAPPSLEDVFIDLMATAR